MAVCKLLYPELVSNAQTLAELVEAWSARGLKIVVIAAQPTMVPDNKPVAPLIQRGSGEVPACA